MEMGENGSSKTQRTSLIWVPTYWCDWTSSHAPRCESVLISHGVIYGAGLEVNHGVSQRVGHEVGYKVGHSRQGVHLDPSDIPGKCWGCHKFWWIIVGVYQRCLHSLVTPTSLGIYSHNTQKTKLFIRRKPRALFTRTQTIEQCKTRHFLLITCTTYNTLIKTHVRQYLCITWFHTKTHVPNSPTQIIQKKISIWLIIPDHC